MLDWHGFLCVCVRCKYVYGRCVRAFKYVGVRVDCRRYVCAYVWNVCPFTYACSCARVREKADGEIFFVRNVVAYVSNITYHNTIEHKIA
jgi:hypothetical protein